VTRGLSFRVKFNGRAGRPAWASVDPACRWPQANGPAARSQSEGPERRRGHLRYGTVTPRRGNLKLALVAAAPRPAMSP
jgi:hypothetical protein